MVSTKIPLKVQKRSGFDKSHHNALTQPVGSIVPVLCDEVIPNSKIYLRYAMAGSMAPLASDTYMKCYYDVRAFFVPMRLLWGGFESWFSNYEEPNVVYTGGVGNQISNLPSFAPIFSLDYTSFDFSTVLGPGSLADYLGYKLDYAAAPNFDTNVVFSVLPFAAYHRVCNDWFRQPNVSREFYARPNQSNIGRGDYEYAAAMLPYSTFNTLASATFVGTNDSTDKNFKFADGIGLFDLRSANYDYDYFTNALPSAQLGSPLTVSSVSSFTIPALRVANSLQQFAELNMLAGSKEVDVVRARYGANLSSGVAQRCVYLGGARIDISTKSVDVTTPNSLLSSRNPFKLNVGGSGGKVYAQGTDIVIDGFTAQEPGYIIVVGVVIPKVTYGTGTRRYLRHYCSAGSLTDMANPLLQNVGNQPIYDYELTSSLGDSANQNLVFGYTDRYAEFMTMEDEVHGLMQIGSSLQSFVAQRAFAVGDAPVISSSFLEVKSSSLDNIAALAGEISNYGFYCQFAFDYKVSQPLAQYSMPSLQNPAYEHGKTIMVHRGGFRF